MKLLAKTSADEARSLAGELAQRLNQYVDLELQADQRLFAMRELHDLFPDSALSFDTLEAELLARRFLEQAATVQDMKRSDLDQPGVLTVSSSGGTLLALFSQRRLRSELQPLVDEEFQQDDVEVRILLPGEESDRSGQAFLVQELGSYFPGWRLALTLRGGDPFASEAERRVTRYLFIALAVVTGASLLAFLISGHFLSQLRLSRFRNDLVATVSHELKTPLSSTRALVETLLSGKLKDQEAVEDYLQLIRRENERLGRLIDNFLTFSRLEHKEALLRMRPVSVGEIVEKAVDAVSDLFDSSGRRLRLEIARDLPLIMADPDGLVIVLVNLLDNACKYSPGTKEVVLRAWQHESEVRIEVCDQGIGLSKRTVARIFDRFYQADQSLSRPTSGCGLGLSIVKFVTEAHGGSVQVLSRPGEGSRFRVALPVDVNPQETH
ncbi:MAG TPA: HAMP domain-containing sensor histidine kinase [Acidobacteriota bacterium]|nr:HAMP domain-containing sensor histidine kinase [Acidobacteriota bacterium]